jgi:tetratricopeptide (TPR) repeat protein
MSFLEGLFRAKPAAGTEDAKTRALAYMLHARRLYSESKFKEAAKEFRLAARLDPDNAEARMWLGMTYSSLKQDNRALAEFQAGLRLAPNSDNGHYAFGQFLFGLKKYADSAVEFERAVSISPEDATFRANLSRALVELQRLDEAERQAREAAGLGPEDVFAHDSLAWVYFRQSKAEALFDELETVERLGGSYMSRELLPTMRKAKAEGRLT